MLIDCRECKAKVSSDAKKCPKCGCRAPHDGKYFYNQKGGTVYVDEMYIKRCPRCGRDTQHTHTVSDISNKAGWMQATKDTCKICGHCDFQREGGQY